MASLGPEGILDYSIIHPPCHHPIILILFTLNINTQSVLLLSMLNQFSAAATSLIKAMAITIKIMPQLRFNHSRRLPLPSQNASLVPPSV